MLDAWEKRRTANRIFLFGQWATGEEGEGEGEGELM
jgi:hypothetical protein